MNREQAREFLRAVGTTPSEESRGWIQASCPLAVWRHAKGSDAKPSFGIRPGREPIIKCLACGFAGAPSALLMALRFHLGRGSYHDLDLAGAYRLIRQAVEEAPLSLGLEVEEIEQAEVIFPESWLKTFAPAWPITPAREYLQQRGVSKTLADELDLRWCALERRVAFPVRDWEGSLRGLHARAIEPDTEPKYRIMKWKDHKNMHVWLGESWADLTKPVVFVESVFDLARVYPLYRNVMAPLSATFSFRKAERVSRVMHAGMLFDADVAGSWARQRLREALPDSVLFDLIVPPPYKDPGDMPPKRLAEVLKEHLVLDDPLG